MSISNLSRPSCSPYTNALPAAFSSLIASWSSSASVSLSLKSDTAISYSKEPSSSSTARPIFSKFSTKFNLLMWPKIRPFYSHGTWIRFTSKSYWFSPSSRPRCPSLIFMIIMLSFILMWLVLWNFVLLMIESLRLLMQLEFHANRIINLTMLHWNFKQQDLSHINYF